jgi:kumamolisin
MPDHVSGEANMDLQVVHAVAPDAKLVLVNAHDKANQGGGAFENLATLMNTVDGRFPGAVWSFSIGWGCDRIFAPADFTPVRAALTTAISHGTTAFDATGDLAGLECKGGRKWSEPPSPDDVGVDAVASLPEMTTVGGTTLSTGPDGEWLSEQAWYNTALIQGTGGGASQLFERPEWQDVGVGTALPAQRLLPDVSAVADPLTGVRLVLNQQVVVGGGTSQAAPIWAGLAALMNEALTGRGGGPLGFLNPLLYKVSRANGSQAFHDISLGGNAIMPSSATGYDMVTGLGTPRVDDLVREIAVVRAVS